jgi:uncharacterized protein (TIGR03790 family)
MALVFYRIFTALLICAGFAETCRAELHPDEVAIVAAQGSRESEGLAKYYAKMRGVPAENICLVDMPRDETCPREKWTWAVRPEIHKWLVEHDPKEKIKCLVTVWDVPLKIGPVTADPSLEKYKEFLQAERSHRLKLLNDILDAFDKLVPPGELTTDTPNSGKRRKAAEGAASTADAAKGGNPDVKTAPADGDKSTDKAASSLTTPLAGDKSSAAEGPAAPNQSPSSELEQLRQRMEGSLQRAQARLADLPDGEERSRGAAQIQQLASLTGGLNVILPAMSQRLQSGNPNPAIRSQFDLLSGRLNALDECRGLLLQSPPSVERDALVLAFLERSGGLLTAVEWLDQQIDVVIKNETGAAFDSELALVMWPENYQLLRWQMNYLRPGFDNSQLPKFYRTLMVSRIDAPTLKLAKGLIDTAIQVEKQGLHGKVYIDARGLAKIDDENLPYGSYADFDHALLNTAKGIKEQTELEVVLDTSPQLFQPGQCPDAALYCGWYSLAKYVDAFQWVPGAVGYHLASLEATTLHDPNSQAWCKRMLESGVCATIGPVNEPYLIAFPRPDEFFALLLRGDLTLVECYARTSPFNSWMMTLIGDPLYRPFKYRADKAAAAAGSSQSAPAGSTTSAGVPAIPGATTATPSAPGTTEATPATVPATSPAAKPAGSGAK